MYDKLHKLKCCLYGFEPNFSIRADYSIKGGFKMTEWSRNGKTIGLE